jgi:hypothetical protein
MCIIKDNHIFNISSQKVVGVGKTYEEKQPSNGSSNSPKIKQSPTPIQ